MARRSATLVALVASFAAAAGAARAEGPDLAPSAINGMTHYGLEGDIRAYSVGFDLCNTGITPAAFVPLAADHPATVQNLYRIRAGRFEHIGMSWAAHEICALQDIRCGPCEFISGGCPAQLGVLCSTATSPGGSGDRSRLGPRSQVNPATGVFPYPFTAPPYAGSAARRLQVRASAVDPAANPGAVYLAEVHTVAADDAAAGAALNNASCRQVVFASGGGASFTGTTAASVSAIERWRQIDPQVSLSAVQIEGDGLLTLGCRVVANANGTWTYNYALHNLNSDRAVGGLTVPAGCGAAVSGVGFSAPRSHSGEPYGNEPWAGAVLPGAVAWATDEQSENPDANAIRWGTAYTFWFTADTPPATGEAVATFFLPGHPATATFRDVPVPSAPCRADWDGSGVVASADIGAFLTAWLADVTGGGAATDMDCDGAVTSADIAAFLSAWLEAATGGAC